MDKITAKKILSDAVEIALLAKRFNRTYGGLLNNFYDGMIHLDGYSGKATEIIDAMQLTRSYMPYCNHIIVKFKFDGITFEYFDYSEEGDTDADRD